jgi:hypothetical protein
MTETKREMVKEYRKRLLEKETKKGERKTRRQRTEGKKKE